MEGNWLVLFDFCLFVCFVDYKSLLNLLQYRFCFVFWFFSCKVYGIAPPPRVKPPPPASEGEVLITGPPGKSYGRLLWGFNHFCKFSSWHHLDKCLNWKNVKQEVGNLGGWGRMLPIIIVERAVTASPPPKKCKVILHFVTVRNTKQNKNQPQ